MSYNKLELYHISVDGYIITSKPITMVELIKEYGSLDKLKRSGHEVIKVN